MWKRFNKTVDSIFIVIITLCLFIPIFQFGDTGVSKKENRYKQELPSVNDIYFSKKFNRFISDRFCYRYQMICLYKGLRYLLTKEFYISKDLVFDKKNNVIYSSNSFWGSKNISDNSLDTISKNIQKFNNFCKSKNIKFYILVIPRRADFVKYNSHIKDIPEDFATIIIDDIKQKTDAEIIYPYEEMMNENKITPVYFKTDHHWTNAGAYIGYIELMRRIQKSYPDIKILSKNDYNIISNNMVRAYNKSPLNTGYSYRTLAIPDKYSEKILDTEYLHFYFDKEILSRKYDQYKFDNFDKRTDSYFYNQEGYNAKILLIGDSFIGNLLEFVPYTFRETLSLVDHYRFFKINNYKNFIKEYQPDIIVFVFRTFYTEILKNLYN